LDVLGIDRAALNVERLPEQAFVSLVYPSQSRQHHNQDALYHLQGTLSAIAGRPFMGALIQIPENDCVCLARPDGWDYQLESMQNPGGDHAAADKA
jgi:hypothetical protein